MRPALVLALVCLLGGCGDGLLQPSGADAGPPPLPSAVTSLDQRLATCPAAAELASIADSNVIFDNTVSSLPLVCREADGSKDLTYPQLRVSWALIILKELRFDTPVPWTSKPLYDWVRETVNSVRIIVGSGNSNYQQAGNGVIMYVNASSTEALTWPTIQQFLGLLMHEVRHAESGGHLCGGQWDNRVSDMGAFGVHNTFFTWIGEHSDPAVIPVEYRPYAKFIACRQRGTAFCMEPHQTCR
jgi:hypothetical protein